MASHFKQGRTLLTVETTLRRHRLTYINNYNHTQLFLQRGGRARVIWREEGGEGELRGFGIFWNVLWEYNGV